MNWKVVYQPLGIFYWIKTHQFINIESDWKEPKTMSEPTEIVYALNGRKFCSRLFTLFRAIFWISQIWKRWSDDLMAWNLR